MKTKILVMLIFLLTFLDLNQAQNQWWPQFRGINNCGVAASDAKPPVQLGSQNLLWKTSVPIGNSSPIVWENKIFMTAYDGEKKEFLTICIERKTGKTEWVQSIKPDTIGSYHTVGSPVQTTPVTDGERVISFFGTWGLICYDKNGNKIWEYRIPFVPNNYGYSTSPIIAGNQLILSKDFGDDRHLLSLDKRTGKLNWKTNLPALGMSAELSGTPLIFNNNIVLHRSDEISAYSLSDGKRLWWFPYNTAGESTPVFWKNHIYVAAWAQMSEKEQFTKPDLFSEFISKYDKNKNGTVSLDEIPEDLLIHKRPEIEDVPGTFGSYKDYFWLFDGDQNGEINQDEYDNTYKMAEPMYREAGFIALNPNGNGELPISNLVWVVKEKVPEVPSPLVYMDDAYIIKDGGIMTCVDLKTGKVHYQERVGNSGLYLSSPVAANGYIYTIGNNGKMIVVKAGEKLEIASNYDFGEKVSATPAIIGKDIYIRTDKELLAFENK